MAVSKYYDVAAVMQVIGCVFSKPSLLELEDKYTITDLDFADEFHKTIFGAIYNLHELGAKEITLNSLEDFFSSRPKWQGIYKNGNGEKWIITAAENANFLTFDYYYNRLKKMSLFRGYESYGIDVSFLYDMDNILDMNKKQTQEEWLDNSTLVDIMNAVDKRIDEIRMSYVEDDFVDAAQAGEGILELIEKFKETPEVGVPLYGPLINTVTRGARLKKLYIRSAATGVGKTRSMIADACYIACNKIYDETFGWINCGVSQPTLFIATEQDLSEIQTMMLAFVSNVNEDHILYGKYEGDEEDRVREAAKIIKASPLYVETISDFSLQDIENKIKKNIRDHEVSYVFFDYIHTSMKILEEITKRSGGVKLREDNILFMLSVRLKDLCNMYGIFIESATQLNGDFKDSDSPDQTLLRGAKAIADKIDYGSILLNVTQKDVESLEKVLSNQAFVKPTIKLSVYKNRRGRYKGIYLWCKADLGTCRIEPQFATSYNYELLQMEDIKIEIEPAAWEK